MYSSRRIIVLYHRDIILLGAVDAVAFAFARLGIFVKSSVDSRARFKIGSELERIHAIASCLILCEINEREAKGHIQPQR